MNLKPIGSKVLLRPSISDGKGLIIVPESHRFSSGSCRVMAKGPRAIPHINEGDVVLVAPGADKKESLNDNGDYLTESNLLMGKIMRGKIFPFGNTVVFERDRSIKEHGESKIIIKLRETQSLFGWVRGHGLPLPGDKKKLGIKINSYCRLTRWEEHMQEFWHQDKFYLIVKESDLLYTDDSKGDW